MNDEMNLEIKLTPENEEVLENLLSCDRVRRYLIETVDGNKFEVVDYKEYQKLKKQLERAKSKLTTMFANGHDDKVLDDLLELCKILEVE